MKEILLGIILFLVGCASQDKFVIEPFVPDSGFIDLGYTGDDVVFTSPKYEELQEALASAEEVIDSLNSYVSRIESELYKADHPMGARVIELMEEGWQVYTVRPGDCLSQIAFNFYGFKSAYKKLLELNVDVIGDPNVIYAGQVFRIRKVF